MDYIKPKNSLKRDQLINKVVTKIIDKVKLELNINAAEHKASTEFLILIGTMIENLVDNKGKKDKAKLNKLTILHEVYSKLFAGISKQELDGITANIESLLDHKMIKKYGILKKVVKSVWHYLQKKLM
jgi:hypothetical protein